MSYVVENSYSVSQTELDLIEGCIRNDRKAQKDLYHKYCNAMFSVAYRIISDYDDANDVLQEAFIQIFRDVKKFRGESTIGAWIKTIVVRTALRLLKKKKLLVSFEENGNGHDKPVEFLDPITGEQLEEAILALPAGYRSVFLLIEVEGYGHKEAAKILGISEGTSKSQLYYAKKQLKKKLEESGYTE